MLNVHYQLTGIASTIAVGRVAIANAATHWRHAAVNRKVDRRARRQRQHSGRLFLVRDVGG